MVYWKALWDSFIMLFVVFDTIGNVPIFYSLTSTMDRRSRREIFTKSVVVAGFLLLFFMFFGSFFLSYYGVTLNDFRIAGGLLLFIIAVEGVLGKVEAEALRSEDIAVVPMATPLLAGPGSIYVVMYLYSIYGLLPTLLSILLNIAIALLILHYSEKLLTKLGKNLILVLSRIMSLLLAVIAITMIREGLQGIITTISFKS
ncbi:MAG: MarC family protein [Thermoprotei archaeon]|nr:MAG: MarC family protein [Thermoprotei archaeon]